MSMTIRKIGGKTFESIMFMLLSQCSDVHACVRMSRSWRQLTLGLFSVQPFTIAGSLLVFCEENIFIWYWRSFCTTQSYKCFIVPIGFWPFPKNLSCLSLSECRFSILLLRKVHFQYFCKCPNREFAFSIFSSLDSLRSKLPKSDFASQLTA